jgi:hypothetical protein
MGSACGSSKGTYNPVWYQALPTRKHLPSQLQEPPYDIRHNFILFLQRALCPCHFGFGASGLSLSSRGPQTERKINRRRLRSSNQEKGGTSMDGKTHILPS